VKGKTLAIVTCILDDWGGSEELWAKSVAYLRQRHDLSITVYKNRINRDHPEFKKLVSDNVLLRELRPKQKLLKSLLLKANELVDRISDKLGLHEYQWNKSVQVLQRHLQFNRPDLVIISQGINFDGLAYANQCLRLKIPYVIVSHKAVNFYWPQSADRTYMKEALRNAEKCFFVSHHNRRLTEEQFGLKLFNSDIVVNPIQAGLKVLPFPEIKHGYRLACVGRLFVIDKGQDMLLRILAKPKWKRRNIVISFFGNGPDKEGLIEMSNLLGLENVIFSGYGEDINDIWATHHALILPSRSEGLPLTLIEAMYVGRTAIVTNAGGNNEVIQHGVTGFVAEANEADLDNVMEFAWQNRDSWESMGRIASEYIHQKIPVNPEQKFANYIIDLLNE
jgi:glycosyltransferase involved in cell wall biosynthesis